MTRGCEWHYTLEAWAEIWEKSVNWVLSSEEDGWLSGAHVLGGADGNVVIERLCLSLPYLEKPFNSKVIKSFVPELRSRKCFCVSGFLRYIYVRYGHYERFVYRYEYVYFTYSYLAMWQYDNMPFKNNKKSIINHLFICVAFTIRKRANIFCGYCLRILTWIRGINIKKGKQYGKLIILHYKDSYKDIYWEL